MTAPEPGDPGERARLPASVKVIGGVTVALFWVVLLTLSQAAGLPLLDALLLTVLLVAVPGLSLAQLPLVGVTPLERLPAYWSSIATLWLLGTACWFVGAREGGGAALGFVGLPWAEGVVWSIGLTAGGLGTIYVFRQLAVWSGALDGRLLRQLLPRTDEERRVFGVLSLAAGFGEEMAYRGYVIPLLTPLLGVWGASALSSVVFGILHGYQGVLGILRTGAMGGMLAWGFVASGSLWPPIVAHVLIDLLAGLWLGDRLLSPEPPAGVGESPHTSFER